MRDLPVAPACRMWPRLSCRANQKHPSRYPAALQRGVSRSSRTAAMGCDGRGLASDDRRGHVRRSRVVLAPRRWRQVSETLHASGGRRGQESPVPGESTKDTVKTIAQGRPDVLAEPVVTPPAFCLQADHGCSQHPAFPAPSRYRRALPATTRTPNALRE